MTAVPAPDAIEPALAGGGANTGAAAELSAALERRGLRCAIEARGSLAVLTPLAGAELLADDVVRAEVIALARDRGFTHVALELLDAPLDGAALRRR